MNDIAQLFREDLSQAVAYPHPRLPHESILRLHCNENPWPIDGAMFPSINRYPDQQPAALRNRMADQFGVDPATVLVTRGADDGIDLLVRGFCAPGRGAIVQCPPAFVMYAWNARLHGSRVLNARLKDPGFELDVDEVVARAKDGASVVFLCAPNNPTGSVIPPKEILEVARRLADRALVVVDEAYIEFSGQPGIAPELQNFPNLAILRTLSKSSSLAGARIGAILAHPQVIGYLLRAVVPPFPLSIPCVDAALVALNAENRQASARRVEIIVEQRERLAATLARYPFVLKVHPSHANFVLAHVRSAARLDAWFREHGILVRDQSGQPGLGNHLRISAGTPEEMDRFFSVLARYREGETP